MNDLVKVIALVPFSDGTFSMYKGEIAEINASAADVLISEGYVKEVETEVMYITETIRDTQVWLDKKWSEINSAIENGRLCVIKSAFHTGEDQETYNAISIVMYAGHTEIGYIIEDNLNNDYSCDADYDYPVRVI